MLREPQNLSTVHTCCIITTKADAGNRLHNAVSQYWAGILQQFVSQMARDILCMPCRYSALMGFEGEINF